MKKCLCIPGESGQEGSPLPAHKIFIEIFIKLNKICWSSQIVSPLLHLKYQKQIYISFIEIFWRIWSDSVSTAARKCQLCLKLNHCLQDFRHFFRAARWFHVLPFVQLSPCPILLRQTSSISFTFSGR